MSYIPLISVIIPVYNAEKTILRCLDSILSQTYEKLEIIIVDDGSTDSSAEKIRAQAERDSRIKYIVTENRGVAAARNTGMEHSFGEWITFVDRDDWLELDCYERLVAELSPDIDFLRYNYITDVATNYKNSQFEFANRTLELDQKTKNDLYWHFIGGRDKILCTEWLLVINREIAKSVKHDELLKLGEDLLFTFDVMAKSKKCRFVDLKKYHYYQNVGSTTHSPKYIEGNLKSRIRLREIILEKYNDGWTPELYRAVCRDQIRNIDFYLIRRYTSDPQLYYRLKDLAVNSPLWKECSGHIDILPLRYRTHIKIVNSDNRILEKIFLEIYLIIRKLKDRKN